MKCLILAAGYATRLYPLTKSVPKPLLKVGDKTILDWLIDDIDICGSVDEYILISNHKYIHHFDEWAGTKMQKITLVDDKTSTNETRLGAVRDIQYAINKLGLNDDMLVMAGDNLLDFSLTRFITYSIGKQTSCIMRYYEESEEKLKNCGVVNIGDSDIILGMEEKPNSPKSHWCCPPFYFFNKSDIRFVEQGIAAGCGVDSPGSFMAWLCEHTTIHAMEMPGRRYDIGNLESYKKVQKEYKGIC